MNRTGIPLKECIGDGFFGGHSGSFSENQRRRIPSTPQSRIQQIGDSLLGRKWLRPFLGYPFLGRFQRETNRNAQPILGGPRKAKGPTWALQYNDTPQKEGHDSSGRQAMAHSRKSEQHPLSFGCVFNGVLGCVVVFRGYPL